MSRDKSYTCIDYRQENILLSLQQQLHQKDLPQPEREAVLREIAHLEAEMGMK